MTFVEYIHEQYPIKGRLKELNSNPIKIIMESDDLPYDTICMIDGQLQKAVELSDGVYMAVVELLSYTKDDIDHLGKEDEDLKKMYYAYMDNIDITDLTIEGIMSAAKDYAESKRREEELYEKCTS